MNIILYMTVFKAIVAWCSNSGIGYKGCLPWSFKEDLRRFARLTKGDGNNAIIMGRKTWESLPVKPLPGRHNVVLSTTLENTYMEGVTVVSSFEDATTFCYKSDFTEAWVIGGSDIYKAFAESNLLSEVEVTELYNEYKCDVFLPSAVVTMLSSMARVNIVPFVSSDRNTCSIITGVFVSYAVKQPIKFQTKDCP